MTDNQATPFNKRGPERRKGPRRIDDYVSSAYLPELEEIERDYRHRESLRHALLWQDYLAHEKRERRKAQLLTSLVLLGSAAFVVGFAIAVAKFVGVL